MIAGVLDAEELTVAVKTLAGQINCKGTMPAGWVMPPLVRRAADMMVDGTQDPNATCNGISIGLGFDAKRTQLSATNAPMTPAPQNPCGG